MYEFIYGIDLNFGNSEFNAINNIILSKYINWVPLRDGNIIFLNNKENLKNNNLFKIAIKLVVKFNDSEEIKLLLKENFCN